MNHERDRFGAYERRTVVVTGFGERIDYAGGTRLELEGAVGRRMLKPHDSDVREWNMVRRPTGLLQWPFSETGALEQDLLVERGGSKTHIESTTALRSTLTDALSWRFAYAVRYDSEVPAESDATDTLTTVALEYAY